MNLKEQPTRTHDSAVCKYSFLSLSIPHFLSNLRSFGRSQSLFLSVAYKKTVIAFMDENVPREPEYMPYHTVWNYSKQPKPRIFSVDFRNQGSLENSAALSLLCQPRQTEKNKPTDTTLHTLTSFKGMQCVLSSQKDLPGDKFLDASHLLFS